MPSSYTNLLYHLVFSTKNRQPLITEELSEELCRYLGGIIRNEGGVQLEIGGVADHIHILAKLKPAESVSKMLGRLKANSSRWINEKKMLNVRFAWQEGYGAFSVSESQVSPLRQYIRNQAEHPKRQTFQEEFELLLKRHGVEYDPAYLWD